MITVIEPVEIDGKPFGRGVWKTRKGEKAVIFGPSYHCEGRLIGRVGGRTWTDHWLPNGNWGMDTKAERQPDKDDIVGVWK